jgi:hypothetical protein
VSDPQSETEHVLSLTSDLLDDIELSRLPPERLILKVSRLARLKGSAETRTWLTHELEGYSEKSTVSDKYLKATGRIYKRFLGTKVTTYTCNESFAAVTAKIEAAKVELQGIRVPDTSDANANPNERRGIPASVRMTEAILGRAHSLKNDIVTYTQIKNSVLSIVHSFVSSLYYELLFSGQVQTIFERYKTAVDNRLAGRCGDVLEKFPSVYERLAEDDPEAVSQALVTCRRIMDSFADSIFPASDMTIEAEGNTLQLGQKHVQNRINAYIRERSSSDSRRKKLRQTLSNLYDRTSSGVHADVTQEEARSLLLNVYLVLGEIILLPDIATA